MVDDKTQHLLRVWTRLERKLELLQEWEETRGILFISRDDSHATVLPEVATLLDASNVVNLSTDIQSQTEWKEKFARYIDGSLPIGVIKQGGNEKMCLLVPELGVLPEWKQLRLKFLLEHAERPFCWLAGATTGSKFDDSLASFCYRTTKLGRPRNPRKSKRVHHEDRGNRP